MSNAFCETCSRCFEAAILAEEEARRFYERLSDLFRKEAKVAQAFRWMAQDEADFANALRDVQEGEDHSTRVHAGAEEMTKGLRVLVGSLGLRNGERPRDLDEAWRWACDLERSVLREAFAHLTVGLRGADRDACDFVKKRVENHQGRLRSLGEKFDLKRRRAILPEVG